VQETSNVPHAYDVFVADCPARTTLDLVADTWSVIAVVALDWGPARYSQEAQDRAAAAGGA
jgi:DNA-binding HxlR family transcriptional regulator